MLVLLINLARRPDRLAFVGAQLDALGIPFERVDAIDARTTDLALTAPTLSPGDLACSLSHRKAWLRFLESGAERCLILEDDVLISPSANELISAPDRLPQDAEMVRLETFLQRTLLGPGKRCGVKGHRLHRMFSQQYGSAAYVITRAFAERLVRELPGFFEAVDNVLFDPDNPQHITCITYQVRPAVCVQLLPYLGDGTLACSDLQLQRQSHLARLEPHAPPPKIKRSLAEKCVREVRRWGFRLAKNARAAHRRVIMGRRWYDVPFDGQVLPQTVAGLAVAEAPPETQEPGVAAGLEA